MAMLRFLRRSFDRLVGWPYGGPPRDHSKSWFRDRADRRRSSVPRVPQESKRRATESLSEATIAHLDAVWLAVGAAFFIGGLTLVTAGWLGHIAIVATIPPSHAALGDEIAGWCLVAVGVFFFAVGVYVLRAFFRELHLPPTLRQRRDEEAKARAVAPLSVTGVPKPQEGFRTR